MSREKYKSIFQIISRDTSFAEDLGKFFCENNNKLINKNNNRKREKRKDKINIK